MLGDMQNSDEAITAMAKLDETSTSAESKALNESLRWPDPASYTSLTYMIARGVLFLFGIVSA